MNKGIEKFHTQKMIADLWYKDIQYFGNELAFLIPYLAILDLKSFPELHNVNNVGRWLSLDCDSCVL